MIREKVVHHRMPLEFGYCQAGEWDTHEGSWF